MRTLSFIPEVYSPNYPLLNKQEIEKIHLKKMTVIPWAVYKKDKMINLLEMGVDGIITDYPNIALQLRN